MRRLFWLVLGVTVGILVVRRVERVARKATPAGLGDSLAGAVDAVRDLADVVREEMSAREGELRAALSADAGDDPKPVAPRPRSH
ncbi:MAG: hypothetical protein U0Q15_19085 [Kineosporiaceae bacterium]